MHTGAFCDIAWDKDGKQTGFISFPYSIDRSPYYQIKVPVCRIANGEGPGLVLMAGNHGDEYEGELTLLKVMRLLEAEAVTGSVTILPATNLPAVMAAKRCSPFDGGNLNRAFPGDPAGGPTHRIAHYVEHDILPRHDVLFDIHSGGTSMDHLICSLIERMPDPARQEKAVALLGAMRMPYGMIADNGPDSPTSMAAALRAGCIGLSGEFGGGATATPRTMAMTALAVDNLLLALGITKKRLLTDSDVETETRIISQGPQSFFVYAERQGWFEPAVDIGDIVAAGDIAGWMHDLERPLEPPEELRFRAGGVVLSRRLHTHSQSGDSLFNVAELVE
ncbi:MAG: succinylglutamate desuccinylase/aspartoacylase family protein [Bauldia sp.]|uniref:succinylglutamate desuccinylase/aspartoacylase family protein n=1 Tax=Bauldia sp. TaxID=2575872 RepID=UPI001DFF6670|nr:succinylglutamate desuccinylase/aspartoacylase family protein [Bauldia sp.]MCB1489520.1 succinylglutamate desuccinylase/aspartoacylase family protein [Bauldia sp.]MCB1494607.1 succinylglutamate desuccinylase/aspartoacylase family protein [Bauldia sp.]